MRDTSEALALRGARVVGNLTHPIGTTDFSSYLVRAQSSGADVVALADTGTDLVNAIKQAAEFGVSGKQTMAGLFAQISIVDSIGLNQAQGLLLAEAFYWDMNDSTRNFTQRFAAKMGGRVPTENQAGVYSSVLAYLRAAKVANSIEGEKVVAELKRAPIEDALFGTVTIRPDGRAIHDMYVFRVKRPTESTGRWDVYTLVDTIPAEKAFRPMDQGGCPLVAK